MILSFSFFSFLVPVFFTSLRNEFIIGFVNDVIYGSMEGKNISSLNCTSWDIWVFENFILDDETFAKALRIFETFVSVNNNICGKLVPLLKFLIKWKIQG